MTSPIGTVALMTPGDMGHQVGAVLRASGIRVVTNLAGRSERTAALARTAGIEVLSDDQALVEAADCVLSILVPAQAMALAERMARAMAASGKPLLFVDCNAIAPATARDIATVIEDAGGRFVDAGIVGPPPKPCGASPRFYASGAAAGAFAQLREAGLDVRVVGEEPGQASALKMCYAALTKGVCSLMTELSVVAERLGASEALHAEVRASQPEQMAWMERWVPSMVPKAHRWIGEMEEIAKTFEDAGVTPKAFEAAAELYAWVAASELARTSPEAWRSASPGYEEVVAALAGTAAPQGPAGRAEGSSDGAANPARV